MVRCVQLSEVVAVLAGRIDYSEEPGGLKWRRREDATNQGHTIVPIRR